MKKLAVFVFLLLSTVANSYADVIQINNLGVSMTFFAGAIDVHHVVAMQSPGQYLGTNYKLDGHTVYVNACFNIAEINPEEYSSFNNRSEVPVPESGIYKLVYNAIGYSIPDIEDHPEINCNSGSEVLGQAIETHQKTMPFDVIHVNVAIYPNPTTDNVTIMGGLPKGTVFQLMDAKGVGLLSKEITDYEMNVDLSHLPVGQYTAYILSNSGKYLHLRQQIQVIR